MRAKDVPVVAAFLRARLREDEAAAHALKPGKSEGAAGLQARVLADVAAKHQLLDLVEHCELAEKREGGLRLRERLSVSAMSLGLGVAIFSLASAYRDHPDWRPAWEPMGAQRELDEEYEISTDSRG
ncbi:DUF6221 family protein [Streptomyces spiralis]